MKQMIILVFVLLTAIVLPLVGQTVEIVVLIDESQTTERSLALSEYIISGGLDSLFSAGFIGTNQRPKAAVRDDFFSLVPTYETLAASVDYLFIVYATFETVEVLLPAKLEYRIMKVRSREIVKEGSFTPVVASSQSDSGIEKACIDTGTLLVKSSLTALGQ